VFCSITNSNSYWIVLYFPIWLGALFSFYFSWRVIQILRTKDVGMRSEFKSVLVYPTILAVSWLPATVGRILKSFDIQIFEVYFFQLLCSHSQGFTNAIFYGKSKLKKIWREFSARSDRNKQIQKDFHSSDNFVNELSSKLM